MWIYSKRMLLFHSIMLLHEMCLFNNAMRFDAHLGHWQRRKHQFHLHKLPQHIPVSLNGPVAELLWVTSIFLAGTTSCIRLSRKCDVTDCRSRPWVATRGRSVINESLVTSLAFNLSLFFFFFFFFYCSGPCSQLSGYLHFAHNGSQHATGALTYFLWTCFR